MAVGGMAKAFDLKNRTSSQSSKASRKGSGKYKTTKNQKAKMICMLVFYNLPAKRSIQNTYEENRENLMFMIFCQEKKENYNLRLWFFLYFRWPRLWTSTSSMSKWIVKRGLMWTKSIWVLYRRPLEAVVGQCLYFSRPNWNPFMEEPTFLPKIR